MEQTPLNLPHGWEDRGGILYTGPGSNGRPFVYPVGRTGKWMVCGAHSRDDLAAVLDWLMLHDTTNEGTA